MNRIRLPHSEIPGSMPICGSPRLIAAYHVLHRLLVPRHPLCALAILHRLDPFPLLRLRGAGKSSQGLFAVLQIAPEQAQLNLLSYPVRSCQGTGTRRNSRNVSLSWMVGRTGLEPVTPALSRRCSNQLSYMPIFPAQRTRCRGWWR